jgi:hypothetical protein
MLDERQAPNDGRRGVRCNRVSTGGQHRGQHGLVEGPRRSCDCEYPRPYSLEGTGPDATFDMVTPHSVGRQLLELDEPVLRRRYLRDHMLDAHRHRMAGP